MNPQASVSGSVDQGFATLLVEFSNSISITFNITLYGTEYFTMTEINVVNGGVEKPASSAQKFLSPRYGIYKCNSIIPVEFQNDTTTFLEFTNMTLRAFATNKKPSKSMILTPNLLL